MNLARFGFTLLAGGILLKLMAGAFPTNTPISLVGAHFKSTLGALYVDAFRSTVTIAGRGIALALPLG
ncbi:MAG TPA: hypothetical protein VNT75_13800, partial [Symbiobacteriaceae bacterium]|nr:hypothetical protein [Symbiobacteriaceae bacterium]